LGNDIVDLQEDGVAGKSADRRFMTRVFTENEHQTILASPQPDVMLWMLWAAKETAFKIVSKLGQPPVFAHKKFAVRLLAQHGTAENREIGVEVKYEDIPARVTVSRQSHYIYSLGHAETKKPGWKHHVFSETQEVSEKDDLSENSGEVTFSRNELKNVTHRQSLQVRFYCKQALARRLAVHPSRLQIIRPRIANKSLPPYLLLDGRRCGIDISFTHHGRFLAWCGSVPRHCMPA